MENMARTGDMTLNMDGKVNTLAPGIIEIEEYNPGSLSLEFTSGEERGIAIIKLGKEEHKQLIKLLVKFT